MFARSRIVRWNNRFARSYGGARFALPARAVTGQMVRDLWTVEGPAAAARLLRTLPPAQRAKVEVEYWNLIGHVVTLSTIRQAFDVAVKYY